MLLSFLFLQGDAGRRFSGQNSRVREAVDGLRGIAAVAFVESPIRIENRLNEPRRRSRRERRQVGADLKSLVLHAVAAGAVLCERLASTAGVALGRRCGDFGDILLDDLVAIGVGRASQRGDGARTNRFIGVSEEPLALERVEVAGADLARRHVIDQQRREALAAEHQVERLAPRGRGIGAPRR